MNKHFLSLILILVLSSFSIQDTSFKFCIRAGSSKYVIKFVQDEEHTATFNLYDAYNNLVKTTSGTWELREEGIYGPATYIIYKYTGINANLPNMKFLFIRNGNGSPQEIRDPQERVWSICY
jgi:hypothetical protein